MSRNLNTLGWGNYANDHEDGNGQFENNLHYSDALTTADRTIFFRYMIHMLAHDAGMVATFMPKPFSTVTGNGLHIHQSLWTLRTAQPLFDDDVRRGSGLSHDGPPLPRRADRARPGGRRDHLPDGQLLQAHRGRRPDRPAPPGPRRTWPTAATTARLMLRVPEAGRIEHRGVDGSANPYLAATALLAAGLDGIDRGLDPGDVHRRQPLRPALRRGARPRHRPPPEDARPRASRSSSTTTSCAPRWARRPGGDFIDYFAAVKQQEFDEYHASVSDWEIRRYLTRM